MNAGTNPRGEHRPDAVRALRRSAAVIARLVLGMGLLGAMGCAPKPKASGPKYGTVPRTDAQLVYHLAVHPLHNPTKLIQVYQPLIDYLNARVIGGQFTVEASRDYASFEAKYRDREPEFLLPNPWQTLQAMQAGYHVLAMAGEPADFLGIFVVRKDSGIKQPTDLIGKAVSYPSPTALAACVMSQRYLHDHGVNVTRDITNRYVGSQESSIMNAYLKTTAAGATWPPPWRAFQKEHPREAAELTVAWQTEPLINNSVMARDDVPAKVVEQVSALLLGLDGTAEGKAILAGMETALFHPATDEDYDIVRRYIARFEQEVRPVQMP